MALLCEPKPGGALPLLDYPEIKPKESIKVFDKNKGLADKFATKENAGKTFELVRDSSNPDIFYYRNVHEYIVQKCLE